MENTIGDFWRMIWQERAPYIFMLISRKDPKRCANYWPRFFEHIILNLFYSERLLHILLMRSYFVFLLFQATRGNIPPLFCS